MNAKNIFKKNNLMPVIVLLVICAVVAAILGAVNMITAPEIEQRESEAIKKSLTEALPGGEFSDEEDDLSGVKNLPNTVVSRYTDKNGNGYVVVLSTSGYEAQSLNMTVGIKNNGEIANIVLTKNDESKDKDKSNKYPDSFVGLDAEGVRDVELIAGITKSSTGIKNAIYDALVACEFAEPIADEGGVDIFATDTPIYRILALSFVGALILGIVGWKVYLYAKRRRAE